MPLTTDNLTLDMIPDKYRWLASTIGIDNLVKLSKACGGGSLYIPETDTLLKAYRDDRIMSEYNGRNTRHLAFKYNLAVSYVQQILRNRPEYTQLSFTDMETDEKKA